MTTLASALPARPTCAQDLPAITTAQWQAVHAAEPTDVAVWIGAACRSLI